ncbi:MAG: head-tail connector protein [Robiginitomaculum sp.]
MALIDLTPPHVEPIDLAYAKTFLRVDGTEEDNLITTLIKTARHSVENIIGRSLIRRTYIYRGSLPCAHIISLPRPPLLSVTRLSLIGEGDTAIDIPSVDYSVTTKCEPGQIKLKASKNWTDYLLGFYTLEIEYDAGYGDVPDDVPLPIRQAILLLLAQSFEHREGLEQPSVPLMVDALLMPYRWVRL